jgi:hypothetical protein
MFSIGSIHGDDEKYKCLVLEVHIPRKYARNIMKSSGGKYISMYKRKKYMYWQQKILKLNFGSVVVCKKNNGIIHENERSTTMKNRKCKVSIKEVQILNFEEYHNPMIYIFYIFAQIGIAFIVRT